jgi:two-component system sensor histidine kinase DesK
MNRTLVRRREAMAGDDDIGVCTANGRKPSRMMTAFGGRSGPLWPDGSGRWRPPNGQTVRWFFSLIWLAYLTQPVSDLFKRPHDAAWAAGGVVLVAIFCLVYFLVLSRWENRPAQARLALAVAAGLAVVACLVYGSDWTPLWIYVSAATGFAIPGRRPAFLAVLAVGGCFTLMSWLAHEAPTTFFVVLLPVLLTGWAMIGFRLQIMLAMELRQARETVARLAVNEERLRLARDMHDLTGQSLSLITLKSELAAKRLARMPQSAELDTVRGEISDIGRVSRQTLHDIREAVSGYRRPTLAVELITARTSLEAAGIHLDDDPALTMRSGTFDPDAEAALAWCLREAATNVIRHSGARTCRVRLLERPGEISLEIIDDGRGLGDGPTGTGGNSGNGGTGLHNMSERLSAVGGRFSAGAAGRDGRGFQLTATVPAAPAPRAPAPEEPALREPAAEQPAGEPAVAESRSRSAEPPRGGPVDANVPS